MTRWVQICVGLAAAMAMAGTASAQEAEGLRFPSAAFDDASPDSATVTSEGVTATVTVVAPTNADDLYVPILTVTVDGVEVARAIGAETDFDVRSAEASIARMDPASDYPAVYFSSFSGGAHCCTTVIVVQHTGDGWVIVPIGDFDGDGDYLDDADGDGLAEIVTIDNRFLYQFDSYAASAAPLSIYMVRDGEVVDVSTQPRFLDTHRDWLEHLDEAAPEDRWASRGFIAGWLATRIRLGEGAEAWQELNDNWDLASDEGEETCITGGEPEDCASGDIEVLQFPQRLRLFLSQIGYEF